MPMKGWQLQFISNRILVGFGEFMIAADERIDRWGIVINHKTIILILFSKLNSKTKTEIVFSIFKSSHCCIWYDIVVLFLLSGWLRVKFTCHVLFVDALEKIGHLYELMVYFWINGRFERTVMVLIVPTFIKIFIFLDIFSLLEYFYLLVYPGSIFLHQINFLMFLDSQFRYKLTLLWSFFRKLIFMYFPTYFHKYSSLTRLANFPFNLSNCFLIYL